MDTEQVVEQLEETKEERARRLDRERGKRYRQSEKGQETGKEYRRKNKEKIQSHKKEYRQENLEKIRSKDKQYYEKTKDIQNLKSRERYRKNPDKARDSSYRKLYGISLEQYNEILQKQNNRCKICSVEQGTVRKRLVVDHCHKTNLIRGLLCDTCNRSLGLLKDNLEVLRTAVRYLEDFTSLTNEIQSGTVVE
jgi:hypothetical protein